MSRTSPPDGSRGKSAHSASSAGRGGRPPWGQPARNQPARNQPARGGPDRPARSARKGGQRAALDPELHVLGRHAVESALRHQPERGRTLWLQQGSASAAALEPLARAAGVSVSLADAEALDGLAGSSAVHQGAVLECGAFPFVDVEDLTTAPALTLALDGVEDPRNLGASARAAYALGAGLVVVPRDRAAACTASAHKAAAGALSVIPVARVGNLRRTLELLKEKGAWVVGAEADGSAAPWQVDLKGPVVLVVGGEDRGLRRLTREACDHVVSIPMVGEGMSLNAADAATVLLYEALRQRRL